MKPKVIVGQIEDKVPADLLRACIGVDPVRETPDGKAWVDAPMTDEEKKEAVELLE